MVQRTLRYEVEGKVYEGIFAAPENTGTIPVPGVILAPNLWGPSAYWEGYTAHYIALGIAVLVVDIYGANLRPKTMEKAQAISTEFKKHPSMIRPVVAAAHDCLKQCPEVDNERVVAVGYCIGGMAVLELGRAGTELRGIVTFHGHLATDQPAKPGDLRAPLLVLHGAEDPAIPDDMARDFITEVREAKADWQMVHFGGQVHAFTDSKAAIPGKACYNQRTDRRSWRMMSDFLAEAFGDED